MARILGSELSSARSHSTTGADSVSTTTPSSHARVMAVARGSSTTGTSIPMPPPMTMTTILPLTLGANGRYPRPRSHLPHISVPRSVLAERSLMQPTLVTLPALTGHSESPDEHHVACDGDSSAEVSLTLQVIDGFSADKTQELIMLVNPWEAGDESAINSTEGMTEEERAILVTLESMARPPMIEGGPLLLPMPVRPAGLNQTSGTATSTLSTAHTSSEIDIDGHEWRRGGHTTGPLRGTDETMATSIFSIQAAKAVEGVEKIPQQPLTCSEEVVQPTSASTSKAKRLIAMFEETAAASDQNHDRRLSLDCREAVIFNLGSCPRGPRILRPSDQCGLSSAPSQGSHSPERLPIKIKADAALAAQSLSNSPQQPSPISLRPRGLEHGPAPERPAPPVEVQRVPSSEISLSLPVSDLIPKPPRRGSPVRNLRTSPQRRVSPTQSLSYRSIAEAGSGAVGPAGAKVQEGTVWYDDVHLPHPEWVRAQAILFPASLALSWIPHGGGRQNVVLDLTRCREVHSLPSIDHAGLTDDEGGKIARGQGWGTMKPFQFVFEDGVERMAADSIRERSQWVRTAQDVLSGCRTLPSSTSPLSFQQQQQQSPTVPVTRSRSQSPASHRRPSPALSRSQQQKRQSDPQLQRIGAAWELPSIHSHGTQDRVVSLIPALASHVNDLNSGEFGRLQSVAQNLPTQIKPVVQSESLRPTMGSLTYVLDTSVTGQSPASVPRPKQRHSLSPASPARRSERLDVAVAIPHPRRPSASPQLSGHTSLRFPSASALTLGATDELFPDDSASQRPPRSGAEERHELPELLTSFQRPRPPASVLRPIQVGQIVPPDILEAASPTKTPAQLFRDSILEQASESNEQRKKVLPLTLPHPQAWIANLSPGQAASPSPQRMSTVVEETTTQAERAAAASSKKRNAVSSHSSTRQDNSREEVGQVLRYLEQDRRSQNSRDRAIEASLSELQAKFEAAQAAQLEVAKSRAYSPAIRSDASIARSNMTDAAILQVQEKLDHVLELVNRVSERSEQTSVSELKHISSVVDELLRKVQQNSDPIRSRASSGNVHVLQDVGPSNDPPGPESVSGSEYASACPDAVQRSRPASMLSATSTFVLPRREWSSADGVPGTPVNSRVNNAAISSQHSRSRPASSIANPDGHEPLEKRQARDISPAGGQLTPSTLDMEAAVRERRRVRESLEKDGARAASILAKMATVEDEPEVMQEREHAEEAAEEGPISRAPSPAASASAARSARAAIVLPELMALQEALKQSEEARKVQQRQQNDIARYLNQLNGWLEQDITERQKDFKALSDGISKLSVEIKSAQAPAPDTQTDHAQGQQPGQWPFRPAFQQSPQQALAESWPFRAPVDGPSPPVRPADEDVDREGLTGVEADEARVAVLQAAHEEVISHIASQARVDAAEDGDDPIQAGSEVLSEEVATELGDAAAKKNPGKIRKIVKKAAEAGAGVAAMATLMKVFHREKEEEHRTEKEEGDKQESRIDGHGSQGDKDSPKDDGSAGLIKNVMQAVGGSKAAQAFETVTHGKKIIDALKDGKYDEVLDILKEQTDRVQTQPVAGASGITGDGLASAAAAGAGAAQVIGAAGVLADAAIEAASAAAAPVALSQATQALDAIKEGKLSEALHALKEGHITEALHSLKGEQATSEANSQHGIGQRLRDGAMGIVGGAVLATAMEELLKHHQAREEREKAREAEKEIKAAEKEAAKAAAEKAREEQLAALQQKHSADIINALAEMLAAEKVRQEQAEAHRARILDPKTAIEALVAALNDVRLEEATKRTASDRAIAELSERMIESMVHQHGVLLSTLATMSKDLVKNSIDDHLKQFRGTMAASFAGSAQAMRDAWLAHAKEVGQVKAIEAPKAAEAPKPDKPKEEKAPAPAPAAAPQPSPPKPRDPRPLGPYGVPPLTVPRANPRR